MARPTFAMGALLLSPHETSTKPSKGGGKANGKANGFPEFKVGVLLFVFFKTSQKIIEHVIQRFAGVFGQVLQF
jgi:hypothetical protein